MMKYTTQPVCFLLSGSFLAEARYEVQHFYGTLHSTGQCTVGTVTAAVHCTWDPPPPYPWQDAHVVQGVLRLERVLALVKGDKAAAPAHPRRLVSQHVQLVDWTKVLQKVRNM